MIDPLYPSMVDITTGRTAVVYSSSWLSDVPNTRSYLMQQMLLGRQAEACAHQHDKKLELWVATAGAN